VCSRRDDPRKAFGSLIDDIDNLNKSFYLTSNLIDINGFLKACHLRIKSEPFLMDLKFKSEHPAMNYLDPQGNSEPVIAKFC
jgi:hypothetical protein